MIRGVQQPVDVPLGLGYAHILPDDFPERPQGAFLVREPQQRPTVPLGKPGGAQCLQHRRTVAQQAQLVGHRALAFSQQPGGLLLAHPEMLHEIADALGLLDEIQILPLQIFHQRRHARFQIVHPHENAGDIRDPRQLRRPKPPLSGDQLIAALLTADGQGL